MKWMFVVLLLAANELEIKSQDFSDVLEMKENEQSLSPSTIRVRTTLDAGIEVPGVTNATVSPEVELFFTK